MMAEERLDDASIDTLFDTLNRYVRLRDRAAQTTFRDLHGDVETAALRALLPLARMPMRSRELAEAMRADPSTVSRQVGQLVELGLVRREADPADGRACLLVLTDSGARRAESMRAVRRDAMRTAMTDWTNTDLTTLVELLGGFLDAAETMVASSAEEKSAGRGRHE